ncbi:TetR/AcrR family transcriptional regulator [Flexivirga oryzae]|uniref:AcrR family transcriptional regulator n=1 Tax=Flexivirga oryzae TaxID=1794944 RepID=A0A839N534_9MICO|nr:TetR family transcriptional regulator [Flexivirga oryzae]MBB2890736.1 AcrR family transcriptional regulator [Flexivirga oryzae]
MALTHDEVIDAAVELLRTHGLADLTMRRLARELQVQPGALYWHVDNKQTLLVQVAGRVLSEITIRGSGSPVTDIRRLAKAIRAAVLPVPDGSDVVALGYALDPDSSPVFGQLRRLVGELAADPGAATDLLVHHVLGSVGDEQNRRLADLPTRGAAAAFDHGLELALAAITATPQPRSAHG